MILMSEPTSINDVITFLRTLKRPSDFDFTPAKNKKEKEKRFDLFLHSVNMKPLEAMSIISQLNANELHEGPSPAKIARGMAYNLASTKDRWIFKHNHIYDEDGHSVTIVIYIKIIINNLNQRLVVVESFHKDM